jgi:hypothetical protein
LDDPQETGIEPAAKREETSWPGFLRAQAASILKCDFLTVDTLFLKRFYVSFFIELATRRVHLAGITTNPAGSRVTQQARNLLMQLDDEEVRPRFLVRDRDCKFTRDFDEVFRSEGIRVIKAPGAVVEGAGARRALGRQRPTRVPRPIADPRPPPAPACPPRLRQALRMEVKSLDGWWLPLRGLLLGAGDRELKRRRWGCLLPRCLAA